MSVVLFIVYTFYTRLDIRVWFLSRGFGGGDFDGSVLISCTDALKIPRASVYHMYFNDGLGK
jgi:hypothetical protein